MDVSVSQQRIKMITLARFQFPLHKAFRCACITCMIYYSEEPILWSLYWAGESSQRRRKANKNHNITTLIMKCLWTRDKLRQLWAASLGTSSRLLSYDSCQGDFPIIKWKHLVLFSCNRIPKTSRCSQGVLLKPNGEPERNKNEPTPHWSNLAGVSRKYLFLFLLFNCLTSTPAS